MDLNKLFNDWKAGRLKYPQLRRESEDAFFGALVERIKAIESIPAMAEALAAQRAALKVAADAAEATRKQDAATEAKVAEDRMAKARAAKAAKREAELHAS